MSELNLSDLNALGALLNDEGENCSGCDEATSNAIRQRLEKENQTKRIRIVKSWMIWDLAFSEEDCSKLTSRGFKPSMLYSQNILWDSFSHEFVGTSVRSTLLVGLFDQCVFETKNTYYILVGAGSRKAVEPRHALSIFF